jgi:hypothetical protein
MTPDRRSFERDRRPIDRLPRPGAQPDSRDDRTPSIRDRSRPRLPEQPRGDRPRLDRERDAVDARDRVRPRGIERDRDARPPSRDRGGNRGWRNSDTTINRTTSVTNVNVNRVTNITNVSRTTHRSYYFDQRTVREYHRPVFTSWWAPYRRPACRTSTFFAIRFGHPGFSLQFTKFGGRTNWYWWYGYGSPSYCWSKYHYGRVCPTFVYRTWWRPTTIYAGWYPYRVTHVHHVYAQPRTEIRYVETPAEPCPYSYGEAWGMIADGNGSAALAAFVCLAREYPYDGTLMIGYAIANAMVGADESAVVAMRRAITVDAEAIRFVPGDERLDENLILLAQHYGELAKSPAWRADALFMMASLRAAVGNLTGAHFTISEAIRHGDTDPSATILRDTLVDLLHENLYGS